MDCLPIDIIRVVATFLTLQELGAARAAAKDFELPKLKRQKRFVFCRRTIEQMTRAFKQGVCVSNECTQSKAVCITIEDESFETPRVKTLSNYCSQHTRQYMDMGINDLIQFAYVNT